MAEITAAMVKALREKTDAPMMECKKALAEANGDMAKAEELIRVKLGTKASKAASRVAAEGLISACVSSDQKRAALVEINSETDFVAKNEDFIAFTNQVASIVVDKSLASDDVASLAAANLADATVEATRTALVGRIGENIAIRRFVHMQAQGKLVSYIHSGKIGVLVDFEGDESVAKDVALHIAASRPKSLDSSGVNAADIEMERSVALGKAREAGKSEEVTQKMVEGAVQKFLKEVSLLSQPFVKSDEGISIEKYLASKNTKVYQFALYVVGEGIEKETTDFAAEVAAQAAGAR